MGKLWVRLIWMITLELTRRQLILMMGVFSVSCIILELCVILFNIHRIRLTQHPSLSSSIQPVTVPSALQQLSSLLPSAISSIIPSFIPSFLHRDGRLVPHRGRGVEGGHFESEETRPNSGEESEEGKENQRRKNPTYEETQTRVRKHGAGQGDRRKGKQQTGRCGLRMFVVHHCTCQRDNVVLSN